MYLYQQLVNICCLYNKLPPNVKLLCKLFRKVYALAFYTVNDYLTGLKSSPQTLILFDLNNIVTRLIVMIITYVFTFKKKEIMITY